MAGYTKLFNSILASSIWMAGKETKLLWITMLAMAGEDGIAHAAVPGLAHMSGLSIQEVEKSLAELSAPDPFSRTKDNEGRRVQEVDGGWLLLNHSKYRAKMGADERREYKRKKQQEYRDRNRKQKRGRGVEKRAKRGQSGHIEESESKPESESRSILTESEKAEHAEIDRIREEHAEEEKRLTTNLRALQESGEDVQAVLDSIAEKGRKPYSAYGWLRSGRSGVPVNGKGLTVLVMLNGALEGRQRAQSQPVLSENNRKAFDAIDRVTDRLKARRDGTPLPREIEG